MIRTFKMPFAWHAARYSGTRSPISFGLNVCKSSTPSMGNWTGSASDGKSSEVIAMSFDSNWFHFAAHNKPLNKRRYIHRSFGVEFQFSSFNIGGNQCPTLRQTDSQQGLFRTISLRRKNFGDHFAVVQIG